MSNFFSKKFAVSKGSAFGRAPQGAKPLFVQRVQRQRLWSRPAGRETPELTCCNQRDRKDCQTIKKESIGRLGLFSAALLWGVSFVLMKNVLSGIPVMYILAIRFCGAALILLPVCAKNLKKLDKGYFTGGAFMGAALLLAYTFQTFGLSMTTPGKNAFLTATYCVIVPFLYWFHSKAKPDIYAIAAAVLCVLGIGFISLDGTLAIGAGDALTIVCGVFFAVHIVITARYIGARDPVALAMTQFAAAGIIALVCAVLFESAPAAVTASDVWTMIFLTVVCTVSCLLLQVFGQKYTPPSQAAVIMTFEAVFGALSSALIYGEQFTVRIIVGFVLTFTAVIVSETKLSFLRKKSRSL